MAKFDIICYIPCMNLIIINKKWLLKTVFIAAFCILTGHISAFAGMTDSFKHGVSWLGSLTPDGQICAVCHTPHNASDNTVAPLWSHQTTNAIFTIYQSPTLNAQMNQPSPISKSCLSCHDGTVAYDSFGGKTGSKIMHEHATIGADLSNDHPISFVYDSALAEIDGGLIDPSSGLSGLGNTIKKDMLFDNKVECSSCHDVHDTNPLSDDGKMLVKTQDALCFTCHAK